MSLSGSPAKKGNNKLKRLVVNISEVGRMANNVLLFKGAIPTVVHGAGLICR